MLYAFSLGPIETEEGTATAYVGLTPTHAFPILFGAPPAEALRELAKDAEGEELRCDPSLASLAAPFGFEPCEPPAWAVAARATLALVMALGDLGAQIARGPVEHFLSATSAFMQAEPWKHWKDDAVVDVRVSGLEDKTYEASIMGAAGIEYGLALYEGRGAMVKIARLQDEGRTREAKVRAIAVTVDQKPAWALEPIEAASGLRGVPVPMKMADGGAGPVDAIDLATLAAALLAVAKLTPLQPEASARLAADGPGGRPAFLDVAARVRPRPRLDS